MSYKLTFDDGGQVLIHHGVKGMKWGVKKSIYKKMSFGERRRTKADYRVSRGMKNSKGGHGKARAVGVSSLGGAKGMLASVGFGLAGAAVGSLAKDPKVKQGASLVTSVLSTGIGVSSLIDMGYAATSNKNKK